MGSLRSSSFATLTPAVLMSPVVVESAAPSIPTYGRMGGCNRLTKHFPSIQQYRHKVPPLGEQSDQREPDSHGMKAHFLEEDLSLWF